jgi:Lar family restriction alleviation protein
MSELKPCPFCGSNVRVTKNERGLVFITCPVCKMTLMFWYAEKDEQEAVRKWNGRAKDEQA